MPSPPPPEHTRFKPGQSGNPAGYSKARRVSAALDRLLDEIGGSDKDLALTLYAMATGRKNLIGDRKPEFMWFQALMERVEGKVSQPSTVVAFDASKMTDDEILARLASVAGGVATSGPGDPTGDAGEAQGDDGGASGEA